MAELQGNSRPTDDTDLSTELAPLRACLELLVEVSSYKHWEVQKSWLLNAIKERFGGRNLEQLHLEGDTSNSQLLQVFPKIVDQGLEAVFSHPLMAEMLDGLKETCHPQQGKVHTYLKNNNYYFKSRGYLTADRIVTDARVVRAVSACLSDMKCTVMIWRS